WTGRLKDPDVARRLEAAEAIGEIGPRAGPAIPALIAALADPDDFVRLRVSSALDRIGKPAFPALVAALKVENVPARRMTVLALNEQIGEDTADEAAKALPGLLKDRD